MIHRQLTGNLLALIFMFATSVDEANAIELSQEYRIKSAYLFNFTKFINWPEGTFQNNEQPLQLCIQGSQEMSDFLHAMTTTQKTDNNRRMVNIKNVIEPAGSVGCHIFYTIQPQHKKEHPQAKAPCKCLIIGDTPMHQSWGSTINFYNDHRRVRFAVDLNKLHRMDINISSELLKLANIYNDKPTGSNN